LQHFITQYGYLAVFLLMMAESACIPVPSEVIMMLGGALAAGAVPGAHPTLAGIVAAGVLGNVAGSYLAWGAGKYAGQPAVRRWGRRVGLRAHDVDRATRWFERHGPAAVLFGRVIPVVRTFISLPAGFAGMPAGRFGLYTTLGCIPWTAALAIAGYALGANWEHVANDFHGPTYAIAGIIAVALASAAVLYFFRRRRRRSVDATVTPPEPAQPTGHPIQPTGHPIQPTGHPMAHPTGHPVAPPAPRGQAPDARAVTGHPPDRAFTGPPPDAEAPGYQRPVPSDRQFR
jgi:membrane protein DedA with SNARE-associated domain